MQAGAIMVAAAVAGLSSPAVACSLAPHTPSDVAERGADCSAIWRPDEYRSVGLMPARNLGQGFILQAASDGNGCYAEVYEVVIDCNRAEAVAIGPHQFDLMAAMADPDAVAPLEQVSRKVGVAAKAGTPMSLEVVEQAAADAGLQTRLRLGRRDLLNLNGRRIALDCGCRTFYPGLKPGN
jgi:hypothetical protein